MGTRFDIEYDDFSGGLYLGMKLSNQPNNTFLGTGLRADVNTGFLMPAPVWTGLVGGAASDGGSVIDGTSYWSDTLPAVAIYRYTGFLGVTTVNVAALTIDTPPLMYATFNGSICGFGYNSGTTTPYLIRVSSGAVATQHAVLPQRLKEEWIVGYGEFLLGIAQGTNLNRLYYSAVANELSWPGANYYSIGSPSNSINSIVVRNNQLLIGTNEGLFVGTGIPGATFSLQQVNRKVLTVPLLDANGGTLILEAGSMFKEISGQTIRSVATLGNTAYAHAQIVRYGRFIIGRGSAHTFFWDLDSATAFMIASTPQGALLDGPNATASYDPVFGGVFSAGSAWQDQTRTMPTTDGGLLGSTFCSGTVELAEQVRHKPFVVSEVLAELDYGISTRTNNVRSFSLRLKGTMLGSESVAPVPADGNYSAPMTYTAPIVNTSTSAPRVWVKLTPGNVGQMYSVTPEVTLQGMKLVRLILKCEEV